ncbi:MAG: dimethyl sulfoxide reductase anchor subunit, partial [Gemmatimonadetes bacterium]|nr:dimethyl sulfoxide reductase anchor subunit [Gemmatimonadota bacterium]
VDRLETTTPNLTDVGEAILSMGGVLDGTTFSATLEAIATQDNVSIISRPKIAVREGGRADISTTQRLPILDITGINNEGGFYPRVERRHLSMGCNHCLEPSCLTGCPVSAYTKDTATGIVDHDPDICIGCQYCTWNCSYGVPQFNAERGVVGKCDMCHERLNQGLAPACVDACPAEAIRVEIVNVAAWRANHTAANAPGMPGAEDSLSTTRITLPRKATRLARVDRDRVEPESVHWSLVFLLVMTQMSVGAFAVLAVEQGSGLPALIAALIGLLAAPAHLGRPIHAWRAVRNWRTSWLSREVIAFGLFVAAGAAYTLAGGFALGCLTLILGVAGVVSSARIYMVPARPAWNTTFTLSDFLLTCGVLGTRFVLATEAASATWIVAAAIAATLCQLTNHGLRVRRLSRAADFEQRAAAALLTGRLRWRLSLRVVCSLMALVLLLVSPALSFAFALCAECISRWLFFAAVVPKSMAGAFVTPTEAAA